MGPWTSAYFAEFGRYFHMYTFDSAGTYKVAASVARRGNSGFGSGDETHATYWDVAVSSGGKGSPSIEHRSPSEETLEIDHLRSQSNFRGIFLTELTAKMEYSAEMNDLTDPRPPLPDWILNTYEILTAHSRNAEDYQDGQSIPREDALEVLRSSEELDLEEGDAAHALSRLIDRGYLYEVNGELRVTMPEN